MPLGGHPQWMKNGHRGRDQAIFRTAPRTSAPCAGAPPSAPSTSLSKVRPDTGYGPSASPPDATNHALHAPSLTTPSPSRRDQVRL